MRKRIFVGYAATWEMNLKYTLFSPGCFSRSIVAFNSGMEIPVLLAHTAGEPLTANHREKRAIGHVLALRQDSNGLECTGVLEAADDFQDALISQLLKYPLGLSVGSWCHESKWIKRAGPIATIIDCLVYEISLSTAPADPTEKVFFPATDIQGDPVPMEGVIT